VIFTQALIEARSCAPAASDAERRRGFTLIELLVALVLLNIGLISLVALCAAMSRMGNETRATARASSIASGRIERMASVSCGGRINGLAEPSAGTAEAFSDTPGSHDTRRLRDSVAFILPGRTRSIVVETRARC
jgi:prepilin-type N-terminal cleavage/methylation domain-containing protein